MEEFIMKKLITYFILVTLLLSFPAKANAQIALEANNDEVTITKKFVGSASFYYPCDGREYIIGPEKTTYYKIYFDANGEFLYGDIIRLADDEILTRVYPDGSYEDYIVPDLTQEQKNAFNDKYNPLKVKERLEAEHKENQEKRAEKLSENYKSLIKEDLLTAQAGDNYILYMYWKPDARAFQNILSITTDINYVNTVENPIVNPKYIKSLKKKIISKLESYDLSIPIRISIVPYANTEYPQGLMNYDEYNESTGEYSLHIVLFNNAKMSMSKQFDVQFKNYLKELKLQ